ncbi:hypothetical protein ACGFNU_21010 [Spirillospora sp. NPDC048911]|uniref:hypothetical protein n=1 Tax=Spirillospora sp. NPDC048911 TaxID=3364527 RepID=UPI003712DF94
MARELVTVRVRWRNNKIAEYTSQVDAEDARDVEGLFKDAVAHDPNSRKRQLSEYEIEVYRKRDNRHLLTYMGRTT